MDASATGPIVSSALSRRAALRGAGAGGVAALLLTAGLERRNASAAPASPTPAYAPGVHAEIIGRKEAGAAPGYYLQLARITFDPGSKVAAHTHPGDTVTYQLAGSHAFTVLAGEAHLVRAGTQTPTGSAAGEPMTLNQEYTIKTGDAILFDKHTAHTAHNPTGEPAVLFESQLREIGQPLSHPLASPVATPGS